MARRFALHERMCIHACVTRREEEQCVVAITVYRGKHEHAF